MIWRVGTPRNMTAGQIVEYWLEMYETKDVMEWYDHMEVIDMPSLQLSFAGMFGHIMLLEWGYNQTVTIATPFLGKHFDQISELDSPDPITETSGRILLIIDSLHSYSTH